MAKAEGKVVLRGGFPAGQTVALYERIGDTFLASLPQVGAKKKVNKHSVVEFSGLDVGKPYWIAAEVDGEWRWRAVTGKEPEQVSADPALQPPKTIGDGQVVHKVTAEQRENAASLRSQREAPEIVTGQRTTKNDRIRGHAPPTDPLAIEHDPKTDTHREDGLLPQGHPKAPDQLESDTPFGVAVEAQPPRLQQADVPKGTPQASSTELGDAAIIVELEEAPLGDIDPNRASGDSAVGPAGTVSPDNQGDKSTSKIAREAEKSAARKPKGRRKPLTKKQKGAKAKRARDRAAERKAAKAPGDLTPGTTPLAADPPAPDDVKPPRKRAARPTRDARTAKRVGDKDAAAKSKRAGKSARERDTAQTKKNTTAADVKKK